MKLQALSLWQPWASLIAIGAKTIETRHWAPPYAYLGERIAIHAAKKWDVENRGVIWREPFLADLRAAGLLQDTGLPAFGLPLGAIIATARLAECHDAACPSLNLSERERAYGHYGPNRFGWALKDVLALVTPIPWRGAQGFFPVEIPDDTPFREVQPVRLTLGRPDDIPADEGDFPEYDRNA